VACAWGGGTVVGMISGLAEAQAWRCLFEVALQAERPLLNSVNEEDDDAREELQRAHHSVGVVLKQDEPL